ncbi:MAG: PEP-CTERM sorting domain-containing protein [Planctomycetota bacterium]
MMLKNRSSRTWSAAVAVAAVAGTASAQPTVIYSNIAGDPTSAIPGGGTWDTDFSFFTLNISTSGEFWLVNFQDDNTDPEVLVAGSGLSGSTVLREGVDGFSGRLVQGIDSSGRINNSGSWVVGADFDGASSDDDVILGGDLGGLTTLYAQEGGAIDDGYGFGSGNTWDTLDTTAIDQSGRVYWVSDGVDGPAFTSANDEFIATSDNQVIAQKGVDIPGNQTGTPRPLDDFDLDDFHVSDDGSQWLARGDIGTPTSDDDALFVNGNIVIRESFTLADVGVTGAGALTLPVDGLTGGIDQQFMAGNGDWYAFGQLNDDATNWAVRNGELVAASGDEIFPGAGETWDDPANGIQDFSVFVGNGLGDYVLAGLTSSGDEVLVFNGQTEILRSGDAIDLDGNGLLDDGVFLASFEFQETRLGDNLSLFALVDFQDASGSPLGSGFITVLVPAPATLAVVGLGGAVLIRRRR